MDLTCPEFAPINMSDSDYGTGSKDTSKNSEGENMEGLSVIYTYVDGTGKIKLSTDAGQPGLLVKPSPRRKLFYTL